MDKFTHEDFSFQPLQSKNKQIKIAVTFLTAYNAIFNITGLNKKINSKKTITQGEDFIQITIPQGNYEVKSWKHKLKRIIIYKGHYTAIDYPFKTKPNFSTFGSIIEIKPQGSIISFVFDDSIRNILGFHETILYQGYKLSPNPVDIISLDNIFIETDIAREMIFERRRSGIIHNLTMDVNPAYKNIEKFRGGTQCYMMVNKDVISSICFIL